MVLDYRIKALNSDIRYINKSLSNKDIDENTKADLTGIKNGLSSQVKELSQEKSNVDKELSE